MSKLLIVLPTCADDAALTERLLTHIYHLNGKQAKGYLLLAWAADVHGEYRAKIKISAELAFETVSELSLARQGNIQNKVEQISSAFRQVAAHVQSHFRFPWLWLEPDCVPLKSGWIEALADAYDSQPKRYCGSILGSQDGKKLLGMARVGIYHPAAFSELDKFCNDPNVGFEFVAGGHVVERCTKTKLIQQFSITDDASLSKIRPDAVLLHGDKWGKVIAMKSRELQEIAHIYRPMAEPNPTEHVGNGNGCIMQTALERIDLIPSNPSVPKIDKRTKEYRALKAAKKTIPLQTA